MMTIRIVLRNAALAHKRSNNDSDRSTSARPSLTAAAAWMVIRGSFMEHRAFLFHEQKFVDLALKPRRAAFDGVAALDIVDFGFDAAGMRRQQQNAVADADRFGDRMGD